MENMYFLVTIAHYFSFLFFFYLHQQGTVLCDIILLNFLKGADQYKAKKFEEVIIIIILNDTLGCFLTTCGQKHVQLVR